MWIACNLFCPLVEAVRDADWTTIWHSGLSHHWNCGVVTKKTVLCLVLLLKAFWRELTPRCQSLHQWWLFTHIFGKRGKYFFFFFISWLVTNKHKKPFWYHGARVIVITDDDLDPYIVLQHPRRTLGEVEVGKIWWEDQDWNKKVKVDQISHMQYRLEMPHTHLLIITQTRQCHHIVGKQIVLQRVLVKRWLNGTTEHPVNTTL